MRIHLEITPLSLNTAYPSGKTGKRFLSAKGKAYKEAIGWIAKQNSLGILTGDVGVDYIFGFKDKRARDVDNYIKMAQDALTGIAFNDDSQIVELTARKLKSDVDFLDIFVYEKTQQ